MQHTIFVLSVISWLLSVLMSCVSGMGSIELLQFVSSSLHYGAVYRRHPNYTDHCTYVVLNAFRWCICA